MGTKQFHIYQLCYSQKNEIATYRNVLCIVPSISLHKNIFLYMYCNKNALVFKY